LLGEKKQKEHPWLYWEFHEGGGRQAVRKGKWKAVKLNVFKDPNGPVELYDLDKDRTETKNLAAQYPGIAKQMAAIMQQAHVESAVFPFAKGE